MSLKQIAQQALSLMDLTTLNDNDTDEKVISLCKQGNTLDRDTGKLQGQSQKSQPGRTRKSSPGTVE